MTLSQPTAFRICRGCQTVSYRITPFTVPYFPPVKAMISLSNSEPVVGVQEGVVYAAGMRPVVKSVRVVAGAVGTKFVFIKYGEIEAVVVTEDKKALAHAVEVAKTDGSQRVFVNPNQLAYLDAQGNLQVAPHHLKADDYDQARLLEALMPVGLKNPG